MHVPAYAASEATLRFHSELFEEHADTAMFLHEQRLDRLAEPDRAWVSVEGIERRIDAHLDALTVGRGRAAEICAARAGSPAGLFVALCVSCRQRGWQGIAELLGPAHGDEALRDAAVLALCIELPDEQVERARGVPGLWSEVVARRLASSGRVTAQERVGDGINGDRTVAAHLLRALRANALDVAGIEALGLLGEPAVLGALLDSLHDKDKDKDRAGAVARALHWITGAPLRETAFIADEVDEAMLVGDELAAWREDGKAPLRSDGRPFGDEQEQLSRDPQRWHAWISQHAAQLPQRGRVRLGKPVSPGVLVALLADPSAGCGNAAEERSFAQAVARWIRQEC